MSSEPLKVNVDTAAITKKLDSLVEALDGKGARSLFKSLARTLEVETEHNFVAQGRPSWVPLAASTRAARMKRNTGGSVLKILQDVGILASGISSYYDENSAGVGAGGGAKKYVAIHQYGGSIQRPAVSKKIRLRTDAKGNLERQGGGRRIADARIAHGAIFASKEHSRVREQWVTVPAYKIDIPARPYLPFSGPPGGEQLQPEAERSLLDVLERHVLSALSK